MPVSGTIGQGKEMPGRVVRRDLSEIGPSRREQQIGACFTQQAQRQPHDEMVLQARDAHPVFFQALAAVKHVHAAQGRDVDMNLGHRREIRAAFVSVKEQVHVRALSDRFREA